MRTEFRNPVWVPDVSVLGCHLETREWLSNDNNNSYQFWVSCAWSCALLISHLISTAALLVRYSQFTFTEEETGTATSCKTGTASLSSLKSNSGHMGDTQWMFVEWLLCWKVGLQHKVLMTQEDWWALPLTTSLPREGWHNCSKTSLRRNIRFWLRQAWDLATGTNRYKESRGICRKRAWWRDTVFSAFCYASFFFLILKIQNNNLHVKT